MSHWNVFFQFYLQVLNWRIHFKNRIKCFVDYALIVYCFLIFLNVYACDFYMGIFNLSTANSDFFLHSRCSTMACIDFKPAKFNIYLKFPLSYGVITTRIPRNLANTWLQNLKLHLVSIIPVITGRKLYQKNRKLQVTLFFN